MDIILPAVRANVDCTLFVRVFFCRATDGVDEACSGITWWPEILPMHELQHVVLGTSVIPRNLRGCLHMWDANVVVLCGIPWSLELHYTILLLVLFLEVNKPDRDPKH